MTSTRKPPETVNSLKLPQKLALAAWVREHYTATALDDVKTAAVASDALGFTVTPGNVTGMRNALGIKPNREHRPAARDAADATILDRLARLESTVADLLARLGEA